MSGRHWEQNKEATVYVGNLDERFTEPLMWELMTQMGPVINVHMPMDRVSRLHQGFGFVEFDTPESADYAARCLNGTRIFGKPARVNKASADRQRATDIGAELFVNNLDPQVDEKILYDTFAQFGRLVAAPNVVRDPANGNASKGYGFVNFDSFDASDAALAAMNGQYLLSKQIAVEYAYKKDGKGERHGDAAERKLASEGKKHNVVPEIQPLPPAFLMGRPAGAAAALAAPVPSGTGAAGPGSGANSTPLPTGPAATTAVAPGGFRGGPAGFAPPYQQPPPYMRQGPPGFAGRGGTGTYGGGGRGVSAPPVLPMAPSGLPARPSLGGLGGVGGPPGAYRNIPLHGFAPPPGTNGMPMAPPAPLGTVPGAPGQVSYPTNGMPPPPPGFDRR